MTDKGHNDTMWLVSQIESPTLADKHIYRAKNKYNTLKENENPSDTQTYIYTHLYLLLAPFKRHQSAACSKPYERAIDVAFMCVTCLYACSVGACGTDNGGRRPVCRPVYSFCCCMQKVVRQTTMKVTSDGQTDTLNCITLWGCLCFCETKHIHMNDMVSWL